MLRLLKGTSTAQSLTRTPVSSSTCRNQNCSISNTKSQALSRTSWWHHPRFYPLRFSVVMTCAVGGSLLLYKGVSQVYLHTMTGVNESQEHSQNILFYSGKIPSKPNGDYIDNILKNWKYDYDLLERHHGYIQWLFPIREQGVNLLAQPLMQHEIDQFRKDEQLQAKVLDAYEMMLDFYGMKLEDKEKGTVARSNNWQQRYQHLNRSYHNYLRITRILKCLGELGLSRYQYPWVEFLIREVFQHHQLANCKDSLINYWVPTLSPEDQQRALALMKNFNQ